MRVIFSENTGEYLNKKPEKMIQASEKELLKNIAETVEEVSIDKDKK